MQNHRLLPSSNLWWFETFMPYRKPIWQKLKQAAMSRLSQTVYKRIPAPEAYCMLVSRKLGFAKLRFVPKRTELRPVLKLGCFVNLRLPKAQLRHGQHAHHMKAFRPVNSMLKNAHAVRIVFHWFAELFPYVYTFWDALRIILFVCCICCMYYLQCQRDMNGRIVWWTKSSGSLESRPSHGTGSISSCIVTAFPYCFIFMLKFLELVSVACLLD